MRLSMTPASKVTAVVGAVALNLLAVFVTERTAAAHQTIRPVHTHSWYVDTDNNATIQNKGHSDGNWDSNYCYGSGTNQNDQKLNILDFGRPTRITNHAPYHGIGVVLPNSGGKVIGLDAVAYLVELYAQQYYNNSSFCPQLRLAVGTNNSYLCDAVSGRSDTAACDAYSAGREWGSMIYQVKQFVDQNFALSQITIESASDMETSGPQLEGWACYSETRAFLDGFHSYNPASSDFYNFGDAATAANCWNNSQIYQVSYGASGGTERALPELYTTSGSQLCEWTIGSCVNGTSGVEGDAGPMTFIGVMTECLGNDPLPNPGPCYAGSGYENAPNQAWDSLWNRQRSYYPTFQPYLDTSTNIKNEA